MKKFYLLFLMALLPLVVSAHEFIEVNGINYCLNRETKTVIVVCKFNGYYTGEIVIPQTVTIENILWKVTSIGKEAFEDCSSLTSVTIPNSVTSIGKDAFKNCSSLSSVTIPKDVTSIGDYAFSGCSSLITIANLSSVTSIGNDAFTGTPWYKKQPNGVVYAGKVLYKYKGTMPEGTKISVKEGTLGIAERAFSDCSGLKSVTIPNSVTSVGKDAFQNTLWFENQPDGVVYAGKVLYKYKGTMPEGTKISIKEGTLGITGWAFSYCSGLTSVTIPNSVTSIEYYAFSGCSSLISLTIPSSVASIGNGAFSYCSALTSVTIPNGVTSIGESAFEDCSALTSVIIPNSVTSIGESAFYGCSALTSVTIPNSVTSIGKCAFESCGQLTDLYCFAENVPSCHKNAFDDISSATLHVPVGSVDTYLTTKPWSDFMTIVKISAKVSLSKSEATIEKGKSVTLKATVTPSSLLDKSVTWKSSNTKVATVTSNGKVKGIKGGTVTITCTSKVSGAKATCKVTIVDGSVSLDKTKVTLEKGSTVKLKPTVLTTSEDKSVTWTTSDKKIATVTSSGKVKGVKAGTATITCTSNATGLKATCKVTVINGTVTLNKTEAYIEKGKTTTLKATVTPETLTDKSVTWTSSDKSIATVSSSGKVKGVKYGTATITCTSNATGASATCQVTVGKVVISMSDFSLKKTRTTVLTATLYPTTLTDKSVTWTSSDKSIATVSSSGKVKGIKAGTATITCTSVATGLKGTCTVTVLAVAETRSSIGNDDGTTGIEDLDEKPAVEEPYDVYDLSGRKVANQVTSLDGLPKGIYIVNGKKMLKK